MADAGIGRPARRHRVLVLGRGGLSARVARAVREGLPGRVLAGAVARAHAADPGRPPRPDLVVVVVRDLFLSTETAAWEECGIPALPVLAQGEHARVGPVLGAPGPCGFCLDLLHRDADPGWPAVRDQVAVARLQEGVDPAVDLPPTLARQAAALTAAAAALALGEGPAAVVGQSWEVTAPSPGVVHRRWPRHPDCPACGDRSGTGVSGRGASAAMRTVRWDPAHGRALPRWIGTAE